MLTGETCRVLTLTGVGGAGKTRLGLQVAADLTEQFADGVHFVDLSAIDSPTFVLPAIARTLGLQLTGGRSALEELRDTLKDKQALLVLDNFEQVMGAVPQIVELLSACPRLKSVVTSREALHIRMENVLPVPSLSVPGIRAARDVGLAQLGQYDAVSLFIERALAVRPDFAVSNETAPAVAEICARLDGLPLAIELAAARVTTLTPHAILERLGNRPRLLTGGAADLPFRQRTLRATIDWSYRMLSSAEQMLLRELAVFTGGATLAGVEVVCACEAGGVEVFETLSSLVDKSLLWRVEQPGGEPRFQMFETIREYAIELLSDEAMTELRARHAGCFLDFAEREEPGLRGPRQRETFDRYEREYDNFQSSLDWLHVNGAPESEMRMCAALVAFYQVRGFLVEGWENIERALQRIDGVSPSLKGKVWLALARIAGSQDRHREALKLLETSNDNFRLTQDRAGLLSVEYERGLCWYRLSRQDRAITHYRAVIDGATDEDAYTRSLAELGIGSSMCMTGQLEEARSFLDRCKEVFTRMGDDRSLVRTILSRLMISYQKEDFPAALQLCREALEVQGRLNDHFSLLMGYNNLGCLLLHLGQFAEAKGAYEKLLPAAQRSSNRHFLAWGNAGLAESLLGLGDENGAQAIAEKAIAIAQALEAPFDLGVSTRVLAEVHLRQGLFDVAVAELSKSVPLVQQGGDVVEYRRAVKSLERAKELARAAGRP